MKIKFSISCTTNHLGRLNICDTKKTLPRYIVHFYFQLCELLTCTCNKIQDTMRSKATYMYMYMQN